MRAGQVWFPKSPAVWAIAPVDHLSRAETKAIAQTASCWIARSFRASAPIFKTKTESAVSSLARRLGSLKIVFAKSVLRNRFSKPARTKAQSKLTPCKPSSLPRHVRCKRPARRSTSDGGQSDMARSFAAERFLLA